MQVHPDGTLLYGAHAGTTHFYTPAAPSPTTGAFFENYRGQVYYWYSDDGGASWHFVDRTLPPNNAPGSGFSDPDFAIDAAGNVFVSEINLANVAVSKSTDSGHSYTLQNFFAQTAPTASGQPAGRRTRSSSSATRRKAERSRPTRSATTVTRSIAAPTAAARTRTASSDPDGLGDIVFDNGSSTLYEAHYEGGALQLAAFRNALAFDAQTALTPEVNTVASGVNLLSHWPAIDVDSAGNVYIAWDEGGNGARAAGVWYSYSKDGGRTWAAPVRVDKTDATDIWPWIAVGSPGRVAIAWFGNDNHLPDEQRRAGRRRRPVERLRRADAHGPRLREIVVSGIHRDEGDARSVPRRHRLHGRNGLPGTASSTAVSATTSRSTSTRRATSWPRTPTRARAARSRCPRSSSRPAARAS